MQAVSVLHPLRTLMTNHMEMFSGEESEEARCAAALDEIVDRGIAPLLKAEAACREDRKTDEAICQRNSRARLEARHSARPSPLDAPCPGLLHERRKPERRRVMNP